MIRVCIAAFRVLPTFAILTLTSQLDPHLSVRLTYAEYPHPTGCIQVSNSLCCLLVLFHQILTALGYFVRPQNLITRLVASTCRQAIASYVIGDADFKKDIRLIIDLESLIHVNM